MLRTIFIILGIISQLMVPAWSLFAKGVEGRLISNNSFECFNEHVRIFNQVPGQPVETLTELIPHVRFPGNKYHLNFEGKRLPLSSLVKVLDAFKRASIDLVTINLSYNLSSSGDAVSEDYEDLGKAIAQHVSLQTLIFRGNWLGHNHKLAFFLEGLSLNCPHLKTLDLSHNALQGESLIILEDKMHSMPSLTSLNLSMNELWKLTSANYSPRSNSDSKIKEMLRRFGSLLTRLTSVDLSYNGLHSLANNVAKFDLQETFPMQSLHTAFPLQQYVVDGIVPVVDYVLHPQGFEVCALLTPPLIRETVESAFLLTTEHDVQSYLRKLPLNMTRIDLSHKLRVPAVRVLGALFRELHKHSPQVKTLDLSHNEIMCSQNMLFTQEIGQAFEKGLPLLPALTDLDLSDNCFTTGLTALSKGLTALLPLRSLNLSHNRLGYDQGALIIGQNLHKFPHLTHLNLSNNELGQKMDGYSDPLGFSMNQDVIFADFFAAEAQDNTLILFEAFKFLPQLAHLDLSHNGIGEMDQEIFALARGLMDNYTLKTLNIAHNRFREGGSAGLEFLLKALKLSRLKLDLQGNRYDIPWTVGIQSLSSLNVMNLRNACAEQMQRGGGRRIFTADDDAVQGEELSARERQTLYKSLALELEDNEEEEGVQNSDVLESPAFQKPSPFFFMRWISTGGNAVMGLVSRFSQITKKLGYDTFGTWLTNTLTDTAHEVVTNSPSYFPNGNNPNVRDWPVGGVFFNTTSAAPSAPALPAVPVYALP